MGWFHTVSWVIWDKDENNNPLIHLDCRSVRSRFLQTMFVKWTKKVLTPSSNVLFWYITISEVLQRNVQSEHMACATTEPSPCIQCEKGLLRKEICIPTSGFNFKVPLQTCSKYTKYSAITNILFNIVSHRNFRKPWRRAHLLISPPLWKILDLRLRGLLATPTTTVCIQIRAGKGSNNKINSDIEQMDTFRWFHIYKSSRPGIRSGIYFWH